MVVGKYKMIRVTEALRFNKIYTGLNLKQGNSKIHVLTIIIQLKITFITEKKNETGMFLT